MFQSDHSPHLPAGSLLLAELVSVLPVSDGGVIALFDGVVSVVGLDVTWPAVSCWSAEPGRTGVS